MGEGGEAAVVGIRSFFASQKTNGGSLEFPVDALSRFMHSQTRGNVTNVEKPRRERATSDRKWIATLVNETQSRRG